MMFAVIGNGVCFGLYVDENGAFDFVANQMTTGILCEIMKVNSLKELANEMIDSLVDAG